MTSPADVSLTGSPAAAPASVPFDELFDLLPAGIVLLQGEQVRFVNRAFEQMTGFPREQLLQPGFLDSRVHPQDLPAVRAVESSRAAGLPYPSRYEARLITADGSEAWHELTATDLAHGGAKFTALVVRAWALQ